MQCVESDTIALEIQLQFQGCLPRHSVTPPIGHVEPVKTIKILRYASEGERSCQEALLRCYEEITDEDEFIGHDPSLGPEGGYVDPLDLRERAIDGLLGKRFAGTPIVEVRCPLFDNEPAAPVEAPLGNPLGRTVLELVHS